MELILAPSILSADFMQLGDDIAKSEEGGATWLHFDVMDGRFVPNISFGVPVLESVRKKTKSYIDVHLMIVSPEKYIDAFADAGADMITFHYEACEDIRGTLNRIHEKGIDAGVVIKPNTPAEAVFPYLDQLEMVLVMGVEPGFGGQKFKPESLDKMRILRDEADRRGLSIHIEIDGGVSASNAKEIVEAGANVLVAGSAVYKGDIRNNAETILANMRQAER